MPLNIDASDTIVPERYFDLETVQLNVLATVNVKKRFGDYEHTYLAYLISSKKVVHDNPSQRR